LPGISFREKLIFLILSLLVVLTSWYVLRSWILTTGLLNLDAVHFIDVIFVSGAGVVTVFFLTRWISRPLASYVGPTESNAVKLLFELAGLAAILLLIFSVTGVSLVNTLVGIGFFGIVFGLAAQSVLGNLFSGIMLLASRPFHIGDRVALITWQYGKFPPSLSHGWLEPSYTGIVKGIALTYTKMTTDSNVMLKIPNALVTQSLIMNLSYGRQGYVGTQFEAPIRVDPDQLHNSVRRALSKLTGFLGEEQSFEVIDMSPTGYLVAISYRTEKGSERNMKSLLLKGIRLALMDSNKKESA